MPLSSHSRLLSQGVDIGYLSGCCDRISDLRKGRFAFAHNPKAVHHGEESPWQELETPGPFALTVKKQGQMTMIS